MMRRVAVYFEFARVAFLKILAYRLRYFTGILTYFVNVAVYFFIWRAIYSSSTRVAGYDLEQMTTYVAIGWIIRSFYFNNIDRDLAAEVIEGKIAINLIKPVDPQLMYLWQAAGEACFRLLLFTLPIAGLVFAVFPVHGPASAAAFLLFAASTLLALVLLALINFFVGTMALQLQSILGVIRAKYFVLEFLSGLLLPLTFFPPAMRRAMHFLPFPHVSYSPVQIYLGNVRGVEAATTLLVQLGWIAALYAAGRLYWGFATRRLSIQGG
jgi:ABC-2 type transport system permease protein